MRRIQVLKHRFVLRGLTCTALLAALFSSGHVGGSTSCLGFGTSCARCILDCARTCPDLGDNYTECVKNCPCGVSAGASVSGTDVSACSGTMDVTYSLWHLVEGDLPDDMLSARFGDEYPAIALTETTQPLDPRSELASAPRGVILGLVSGGQMDWASMAGRVGVLAMATWVAELAVRVGLLRYA